MGSAVLSSVSNMFKSKKTTLQLAWPFIHRSARLIPEGDQIFTEVELKTLERVINETMVCNSFISLSHSH